MGQLEEAANLASEGKGSTTIISGEAGIGKSKLVEEFKQRASQMGMGILSGAAASETIQPFQIFSQALEEHIVGPLFREQEYTSFSAVFAVNKSGLLMGQASSGTSGGLDADIFAGMLSAVQNFVQDSFDSTGTQTSGLGRLEYGNMKIIIKHGQHIFLTAVFNGIEHQDMGQMLKKAIENIEERYAQVLEKWSGNMREIAGIQAEIEELAKARFLVRRDMEGVKLENERLRIAGLVHDMIGQISQNRPYLLLLEDLHWADESSLFVLNYLARNITRDRIIILGTCRPRENQAIIDYLARANEQNTFNTIQLGRLDNKEIMALIDNRLGSNDLPDEFVQELETRSEGNPFFITEMLTEMQKDGSIATMDGKYSLISGDYSIPSTVEEVVHRRLDKLEPDSLALVEYMSCIGKDFDCQTAFSLDTMENPDNAFSKLVKDGIVISDNGGGRFSHTILHDVTYQSIGRRWKQTYHRSIGQHLEGRFENEKQNILFELARHFYLGSVPDKAFEYSVKAGEMAESTYAAEEAIDFYSRALEMFGRLGSQSPGEVSKFDLLERRGDLRIIVAAYDDAISDLETIASSDKHTESSARALRKIGQIYEKKGNYDGKLEMLDKALELLGDLSSEEQGRLILAKGQTFRRRGEHDKAMEHFNLAMESLDRDMPSQDLGETLLAIGLVHWHRGEYELALESMQKALDNHKEIKYEYGIAAAHTNMANVYSARDELDKALDNYQKAFEIFNRIGEKYTITILLNNIGNNHEDRGELDKALEYHLKALDIRSRIGMKKGMAYSMNNIGNIYREKGELDKALEYFSNSLEILQGIGDRYAEATVLENIGDVRYFQNRYRESLEGFENSLTIRREIGDKKGIVSSLCNLSMANQRNGELDTARELSNEALELSRTINSKFEEAISLRSMANLHIFTGEYDEALALLDKCQGLLDELKNTKQLPKVLHDRAVALAAQGLNSEARAEFERALAMFQSMGFMLWVKRCQTELAKL